MLVLKIFQGARKRQQVALAGDGCYEKWAEAVSVVDGPFPGRAFTTDELGFACRWALAQREFGIVARLLPDVDGAVRVLAVAGSPLIPAEWVIYPYDGGIRSDESVFGSAGFLSLADALCEIREMPQAQAQAVPAAVQTGLGFACA